MASRGGRRGPQSFEEALEVDVGINADDGLYKSLRRNRPRTFGSSKPIVQRPSPSLASDMNALKERERVMFERLLKIPKNRKREPLEDVPVQRNNFFEAPPEETELLSRVQHAVQKVRNLKRHQSVPESRFGENMLMLSHPLPRPGKTRLRPLKGGSPAVFDSPLMHSDDIAMLFGRNPDSLGKPPHSPLRSMQSRQTAPPDSLLPIDMRKTGSHLKKKKVKKPKPYGNTLNRYVSAIGKMEKATADRLDTRMKLNQWSAEEAATAVAKCLEQVEKAIPGDFILNRNLGAFVKARGRRVVNNIFSRLLYGKIRLGWEIWRNYVQLHRDAEVLNSAMLLQRVFRGVAGRIRAAARRREVMRARMVEARRIAKLEEFRCRCATKLQSAWRMHDQRTKFLVLVEEDRKRERTAVKLQRWYRAMTSLWRTLTTLARIARENRCALKIQKVARGFLARIRAHRRRREKRIREREKFLADPSRVILKTFWEEGAARILCSWYKKKFLQFHTVFIGHACARTIQRVWTGHLGRNIYRSRKAFVDHMLEYQRFYEALDQARVHASATLIQAKFRGHRTYLLWMPRRLDLRMERLERMAKKAAAMRAAAERSVALALKTAKQTKLKEDSAALIQKWWHQVRWRVLVMRIVRKNRKETKKRRNRMRRWAAYEVQRLWRGYKGRQLATVVRQTKAIAKIVNWLRFRRLLYIMLNYPTLNAASTVICMCWRRYAYSSRVNHRVAVLASTILLQRVFRRSLGRWLRQTLLEERRCMLERRIVGAREVDLVYLHIADSVMLAGLGGARCGGMACRDPVVAPYSPSLKNHHCAMWLLDYCTGGKTRIDGPTFSRMCRDMPRLANKHLDTTAIDIAFSRVGRSSKSLDVDMFIDALREVANVRFPNVHMLRCYDEEDARVLTLFRKHAFLLPEGYILKENLNKAVQEKVLQSISPMQRAWRKRQARDRARAGVAALRQKHWEEFQHAAALVLQCAWRQHWAFKRMNIMLKTNLHKFIDPEAQAPYWVYVKSGTQTWYKPSLLGDDDVPEVYLPKSDREFQAICQNCQSVSAKFFCCDCATVFCADCFLEKHGQDGESCKWIPEDKLPSRPSTSDAKAAEEKHEVILIETCEDCAYQAVSRTCIQCADSFCCNCFFSRHKTGRLALHSFSSLVHMCELCKDWAARWRCTDCGTELCWGCLQEKHVYDDGSYHAGEALPPYMCFAAEDWTREQERKQERLDQKLREEQDKKYREGMIMLRATLRIQAVWRGKQARLQTSENLLELKKQRYRREADSNIRSGVMYTMLQTFGVAPDLPSDTVVHKLKNRPIWTRAGAAVGNWIEKERKAIQQMEAIREEEQLAAEPEIIYEGGDHIPVDGKGERKLQRRVLRSLRRKSVAYDAAGKIISSKEEPKKAKKGKKGEKSKKKTASIGLGTILARKIKKVGSNAKSGIQGSTDGLTSGMGAKTSKWKEKLKLSMAKHVAKVAGALAERAGTRALEGGKKWGKVATYLKKKADDAGILQQLAERDDAAELERMKEQARIKELRDLEISPSKKTEGLREAINNLKLKDQDKLFHDVNPDIAFKTAFPNAMDLRVAAHKIGNLEKFVDMFECIALCFYQFMEHYEADSAEFEAASIMLNHARELCAVSMVVKGASRGHVDALINSVVKRLRHQVKCRTTGKFGGDPSDAPEEEEEKKKDGVPSPPGISPPPSLPPSPPPSPPPEERSLPVEEPPVEESFVPVEQELVEELQQPPVEAATWVTCYDASGNVYYYNQYTAETAWELPEGEIAAPVEVDPAYGYDTVAEGGYETVDGGYETAWDPQGYTTDITGYQYAEQGQWEGADGYGTEYGDGSGWGDAGYATAPDGGYYQQEY